MSAGFRKSFLGFNCDDVIKYIETAQAKFVRIKNELEAKNSDLEEKLNNTNSELEDLKAKNAALMAEVEEYRNKHSEIEQLSASIGKLYLVSQNSAKSIMNNSVASSQLASEQIEKNIESIETAHSSLSSIRDDMEKTANEFIENLNNLCESLENTKQSIKENSEESEKHLEEFNAIFKKINNAQ